MTGNVELAEQLISSIDDSHVRALLTGQLAETRGEDAEPHYRRALDLAGDDDQRRADALLALASVGAADVPGLEEFVCRHPHIRSEVEAARALAAGRRDEGIEHLRQDRRTSPTAALRLAQAYAEAGDTDGVVDTLRDAAADFHNPQLQLNAVQELLRAGRIPDAQAELDRLLTSGTDWAGRADALRLAADLAAHDGRQNCWTLHSARAACRGEREVAEEAMARLRARLATPVVFTFERFMADGDYVVLQARGRATAVTGLPCNNTYCIVARIVDGRILEMTDYIDTELITRALFGTASSQPAT